MRLLLKTLLLTGFCLLEFASGFAQGTVHLIIETNYPEAVVYADSQRIGLASEGRFTIAHGTNQIRLIPSEAYNWSIDPVSKQITAQPGDTLTLTLRFPYYYKIESIPYGADVYLEIPEGRRHLGATPVIYRAPGPLTDVLSIQKTGYVTEELEPGKEIWNQTSVVLGRAARTEERTAEVRWTQPSENRAWIDYAAVGLSLTAGVLAVHYKFKADRLYDEYRRSGDPLTRDRINHFDTLAGVSLATMQVGLGVFAIRLALR